MFKFDIFNILSKKIIKDCASISSDFMVGHTLNNIVTASLPASRADCSWDNRTDERQKCRNKDKELHPFWVELIYTWRVSAWWMTSLSCWDETHTGRGSIWIYLWFIRGLFTHRKLTVPLQLSFTFSHHWSHRSNCHLSHNYCCNCVTLSIFKIWNILPTGL